MKTKQGYYFSESKGQLKIKDMPTPHIKNAIVKLMENWVQEIKQLEGREFIDRFANPINDTAVLELYSELMERELVENER